MDYKDEEIQEEQKDLEESHEQSNNQDFNDESLLNSEPPEYLPQRGIFEGVIGNAKAIAKQHAIKALFSKPVTWIVIGVIGIIFFIFILVFQMDFDLHGIGNINPESYNYKCDKIYLTWQKDTYEKDPVTSSIYVNLAETDRYEYEEYTIDEFVAGVIWTDNRNFLDVDNEIVYEAMAIAKRSYIVVNLADNCVVLRDYDELANNFTKLNGSEEKAAEIKKAVSNTSGKIIGKHGDIIPAVYDSFSYTKKKEENEEGTYFYHMMNENEQGALIVPANWVLKTEKERGIKIPKEHVNSTKKFTSLSIYGAKYLLEKVDSQYELYRILETYYGRDIEYYRIGQTTSTFNTTGCMWWPIGGSEITLEDGISYAKGTPTATSITSPFGPRKAPTAGASSFHKAIDIGGGANDNYHNIIAAADGVVIEVGTGCVNGDNSCYGGLGNFVKIKHNDGTITRYGHMSSVFVSLNANVKQGQVIGKMGKTGVTTGVHLDFQVIVNGEAVNPLNFVSAENSRQECSNSGGVVSGNNNSQTICLTLKNQGYSDNAVAAMLGNFQAESGLDPAIVNSIGCVGIAQWCGRGNTLKSMYGSSWNTLDAQLNFLLYELDSPSFSSVKNNLNGDTSASEMAHYFCMHFEIPGEYYCNNGERQKNANNWLSYVTNGCS